MGRSTRTNDVIDTTIHLAPDTRVPLYIDTTIDCSMYLAEEVLEGVDPPIAVGVGGGVEGEERSVVTLIGHEDQRHVRRCPRREHVGGKLRERRKRAQRREETLVCVVCATTPHDTPRRREWIHLLKHPSSPLLFSAPFSALLFSTLLLWEYSSPHLVLLRRVEAKGHIIHRSRLWDHPRQQPLEALEPEEAGREPAVEGGARVEALRIEGHQIEQVGGARAGVA